MEILKFPDKRLLTKCRPVLEFDAALKATLHEMHKMMVRENGKGLAANQVGLDIAVFIMVSQETGNIVNFINPKIVKESEIFSNLKEGCLSAPGDLVFVGRPSWVIVEFQNWYGGAVSRQRFEGIDAVCIKHEMDHLEGKVFFQASTVPKKLKKKLEKKWGLR